MRTLSVFSAVLLCLALAACQWEANPPSTSNRQGPGVGKPQNPAAQDPLAQPTPTPAPPPAARPAQEANPSEPSPQPQPAPLSGTWHSGCVNWDSAGSWTEEILLEPALGNFWVTTMTYGGKTCEPWTAQVRYRIQGGLLVGGELFTPEGPAKILTFINNWISATPQSAAMADLLNLNAYCGFFAWQELRERSIAGQICNGVVEPPFGAPSYNIVKIFLNSSGTHFIRMGQLPSPTPESIPTTLYPVDFYRY